MLFGRQIKTILPQAPQKMLPSNINYKVLQNREKTYRANAKQNYDRKRRAQNLPSLKEGDGVHVKDMNIEG
jgi:hypothetical protein